VSRYQKGKTNPDFTGARDSEWQWHQLGRMQVCTSLQTDNHASTPPLSFLHAGCLSCRPTNNVKTLKGSKHRGLGWVGLGEEKRTHVHHLGALAVGELAPDGAVISPVIAVASGTIYSWSAINRYQSFSCLLTC